jgi:hypothetical protein
MLVYIRFYISCSHTQAYASQNFDCLSSHNLYVFFKTLPNKHPHKKLMNYGAKNINRSNITINSNLIKLKDHNKIIKDINKWEASAIFTITLHIPTKNVMPKWNKHQIAHCTTTRFINHQIWTWYTCYCSPCYEIYKFDRSKWRKWTPLPFTNVCQRITSSLHHRQW